MLDVILEQRLLVTSIRAYLAFGFQRLFCTREGSTKPPALPPEDRCRQDSDIDDDDGSEKS